MHNLKGFFSCKKSLFHLLYNQLDMFNIEIHGVFLIIN